MTREKYSREFFDLANMDLGLRRSFVLHHRDDNEKAVLFAA